MKRITCIIAAFLGLATMATASPVSEATARRAAVNFWNTYHTPETKNVEDLELMAFAELPHLYVFANGGEGFVIMAGDDCAEPVLAYAFDMPFPTELHPSIRYWLNGYEARLAEIEKEGLPPTEASLAKWNRLLSDPIPPTPRMLMHIVPMVLTHWDQGYPYNNKCPYDSVAGERAVVGCVATAMAQLMRFWKHPSCGVGSHAFRPAGFDSVYADYEHTTYLWDYMPTSVSSGSRTRDIDAIATLSLHCGVSVNMMYGISSAGGSGAYSQDCISAFRDNFRYKPSLNLYYRGAESDNIWNHRIETELEAGRPIYYTGHDNSGGHAFILDGSDTNGRYHFNWGWGGYADGYFFINDMAPGRGGTGGNETYTFNQGQSAIFGLEPEPQHLDSVTVVDTFCTGTTYFQFYEHSIRAKEDTFLLVHLDTVFTLILHKMSSQKAFFSANGAQGSTQSQVYCPADGLTMPTCPFTRPGYRFRGWCEYVRVTNDYPLYRPGEVVRIWSNITYYAIWQDSASAAAIETVDDSEVHLWPNPAHDRVNIALTDGGAAQIVLYDRLGRVMLQRDILKDDQIDLSGLSAGLYAVRVATPKGVSIKHVIKQ